MVYCGKASKGCEHCRTRRIKCDKRRPECSQCVRAGKKCSGYRDQLSLMFRDENTKVIQRAHAQWGVSGSSSSPTASSTSPPSSTSPAPFSNGDGSSMPGTPVSLRSASARQALVAASRLPQAVAPTMAERGTRFYVEHYIINYPQEPKTPVQLQDASTQWMLSPANVDVMAAVGLSGLANLTGDAGIGIAAREKYGVALRNTAMSIQNPNGLDPRIAMRSVVLLAMFEFVQGQSEMTGSLRAHIMGAVALLSTLVPQIPQQALAFRGIIQLCFSMLIPCYMEGVSLPEPVARWIMLSNESLPPDDKPSAQLLLTICRYIQLSASTQQQRPPRGTDGQAAAIRNLVALAMLIDAELAAWEEQQQRPGSKWAFTTEEAAFPPEAAFRGRYYHVYAGGMWTARVWNHYRWARILLNQTALDLVDELGTHADTDMDSHHHHHHHQKGRSSRCSSSSGSSTGLPPLSSDDHPHDDDDDDYYRRLGAQCQATIRRLARDILVGLPTHFRHPRLTRPQRDLLDRTCLLAPTSGGGVGSAGIPHVIGQVAVAVCAPGVPAEYAAWALGMLDTIWAETGMRQARTLAGQVRRHLEGAGRRRRGFVEVKVKEEEREEEEGGLWT